MALKNYTKLKTISILCLALCGASSWYHFISSPQGYSLHTPSTVAAPIQAQYTLANTLHTTISPFLEKLKPYFTFKYILFIATVTFVVIRILWFQGLYRNYGTQQTVQLSKAQTPTIFSKNDGAAANINVDKQSTAILISKAEAMIRGSQPLSTVTPADISIFNTLTASTASLESHTNPSALAIKKISPEVQQKWTSFTQKPKKLTIDMEYMYQHYKYFKEKFFSRNVRNLLLVDKIVAVFPEVTTITCTYADCIGWTRRGGYTYATRIVDSDFIEEMLSTLSKHPNLQEMIIKTDQHKINLGTHGQPSKASDWYIGTATKTIIFTKNPYAHFIPKIEAIIEGKFFSNSDITSLDKQTFDQLVSKPIEAPDQHLNKQWTKLQAAWDQLKNNTTTITISMEWIYRYQRAFYPVFFFEKPVNLFLLDKIVALFPHVTEVTCTHTDLISPPHKYKIPRYQYKASTVGKAFIGRLVKSVKKLHAPLEKIIIKTYRHAITNEINSFTTAFGILGWQVKKENKYIQGIKEERTEGTITLTKVSAPSKKCTIM